MTYDRTVNFIGGRIAEILTPPADLSVSEWSTQHRVLVSESSAESGRWRNSKTPYLVEPMNAMSDRNVRKVVLMMAAQLGKTEGLINGLMYFADTQPGPMMYVLPNEKIAKLYSTTRIAPAIDATPRLHGKFARPKTRDGTANTLQRSFTGGYLVLCSAESPADLQGKPIRILVCDEIDQFQNSKQGDPVSLAVARQTTFFDRKTILVSTPTIAGSSKIYQEFIQGTQEQWFVPCPSCASHQILSFYRLTEHPTDPKHRCQHCGNTARSIEVVSS
jgi:phage terminase large subunit GpA-like protein